MLSSNAEETLPAQDKAERGNKRVEEQESSTSESFSFVIKMREEIKRRDEQFREELRWRDENLATKNRTREETKQQFSNKGMRNGEKS